MDSGGQHEQLDGHLPIFITAPGSTDVLMVTTVIIAIGAVLLAGVFYFSLHALPERMAHKYGRSHMQIVALLAILALFTHNNYFWIAALLLAAINLPDYETPLNSIAKTLRKSWKGDKPDD
ncbi:hypothetical protein PsAD2_03240 [Pseudovibrio axinellae]|uniref:Uncharacterized protein n=1 Tax=Pseudovibrio axinellae TaxID=989403 RepID=A0A165WYE5_9HYPH|nr:hypothetical protein [Pseudovibrio axinellae]KZL17037.1 hypothetical protein PsAD2_03240 [Pseudovibrio axinellae]SEQ17116.1 hypothetical protein SAMN05421798_10245 [Pseudovibrio axinellae]